VEPKQTATQTNTFSPASNGLLTDFVPANSQLELQTPQQVDARSADSTPQPTATFAVAAATRSIWRRLSVVGIGILLLLIVLGGSVIVMQRGDSAGTVQTGSFNSVQIPLDQLDAVASASVQTLAVNGRLLVGNSLVVAPSTQPANAVAGQLYFDQTSNQLAYYNGSAFVNLLGGTSDATVQNTTTITNINSTANAVTSTGGTTGRIAKFTGVRSMGNSIMTDTGTSITVEGNVNLLDPPTDVPETNIWPTNPLPAVENQIDAHVPPDVELGVKFRSDVAGVVTGIRFYKGTSNTGSHTGSLWSGGGALLATGTFVGESASGWQEMRFTNPVAISADTTYVASYHTAAGFYSITQGFFAGSGVDNNPLHALQDGIDGPNGLFRYSLTPAFPNQSFDTTNYWVDVLFKPGANVNKYMINGAQISSGDLINNAELAKRGSSQTFTGVNLFRNGSDSTSAFGIQSSGGLGLFSADTLNARIYIGPQGGNSNGVILVLATKTGSGEPVGVDGAMYYKASLGVFRCYENGYWRDCMPNARTTWHRTIEMTSAQPDNDIDFTTSGGGGAFANAAAETGHPSIVQLDTGTGGAASWVFAGSRSLATGDVLLGNGDYWRYESVVRPPVLSAAGERYTYRAGFLDSTSGDGTDGCFFRYVDNVNSGAWQGVCRDNSVEASCNTAINVVAATWYRLNVVVNAAGTSADFQINGTSRCQVGSSLPIGVGRQTSWGTSVIKEAGTTSRIIDLDYIDVQAQFGSAR
jgi:Domain of unknown function (DUF4082)